MRDHSSFEFISHLHPYEKIGSTMCVKQIKSDVLLIELFPFLDHCLRPLYAGRAVPAG